MSEDDYRIDYTKRYDFHNQLLLSEEEYSKLNQDDLIKLMYADSKNFILDIPNPDDGRLYYKRLGLFLDKNYSKIDDAFDLMDSILKGTCEFDSFKEILLLYLNRCLEEKKFITINRTIQNIFNFNLRSDIQILNFISLDSGFMSNAYELNQFINDNFISKLENDRLKNSLLRKILFDYLHPNNKKVHDSYVEPYLKEIKDIGLDKIFKYYDYLIKNKFHFNPIDNNRFYFLHKELDFKDLNFKFYKSNNKNIEPDSYDYNRNSELYNFLIKNHLDKSKVDEEKILNLVLYISSCNSLDSNSFIKNSQSKIIDLVNEYDLLIIDKEVHFSEISFLSGRYINNPKINVKLKDADNFNDMLDVVGLDNFLKILYQIEFKEKANIISDIKDKYYDEINSLRNEHIELNSPYVVIFESIDSKVEDVKKKKLRNF